MESSEGNGCSLAITDGTGLLFYGGALGWTGLYKDYKSFHGLMVPQTVSSGRTPEVTARIMTLDDIPDIPTGFFDAAASGGDLPLLKTVIIDEITLRKNLLPGDQVVWPPVKEGLLEGVLTTTVDVDRTGKVRNVGTIVSDNRELDDAARQAISGLQFKPYLQNGVAV